MAGESRKGRKSEDAKETREEHLPPFRDIVLSRFRDRFAAHRLVPL